MRNNMDERTTVGIIRVTNIRDHKEIREDFYKLLDTMNETGVIKIPLNARVMIKPNICLVRGYETGATVDPFLVECLIVWLIDNYSIQEIIIGESDATMLNIDIAFKALGWERMAQKFPMVRLLNLSKDNLVDIPLKGLFFKGLKMSKTYMESDFLISFAKLKTHTFTKITGNMKNLFGANPVKYKAQYHVNIDKVICDLNSVRKPDLCLVDGIIAMEGDGPVAGEPRPAGLILAGNDTVATDHACARVMGFNPNGIAHLVMAKKCGIGSFTYKVVGQSVGEVTQKFKFVPLSKQIALGTIKVISSIVSPLKG
jgi:uncharacterized protein (DUF362 family)